MKTWRLTPRAENSLINIFRWTIENFGQRQAIAYRDSLIDCINRLAEGHPPHARSCAALMPDKTDGHGLTYYREGGHYIILRETRDRLDVLEFFHQNSNIAFHLERLTE